jgi:hypothetical protein
MTARQLQSALVEKLTELLKGRRYHTPDGGTAAPTVFAQNLPRQETAEEVDPFPYVIVRIDSGNIETQTSPYKVAVVLIVGIYDEDLSNQGHMDVLDIFEHIQSGLEANPLVGGEFVFTDPFNWALQDEESYPYFFGAASLSFSVPAPRREWSELV